MEGIVLRIYPYGEADLILRILTPSDGKLAFFARNAKKSKKRFAGAPDILDWGMFSSVQGKGRLPCIKSFKSKSSFPALREDIDKLSAATYLCEAFDLLIPEHSSEHADDLFQTLILGLQAVSEAVEKKEILRSLFLSLHALLHYSGLNGEAGRDLPSAKKLIALLNRIEHAVEKKLESKELIIGMIKTLQKEQRETGSKS